MSKIRTRFAPSPTGFLHIGNLRTAIFAYLVAKHEEGTFILRVEDTDRTRYVESAEQKLYEILRWSGLKFDEGPEEGGGYGPYIQSQRKELYGKYADQLVGAGKAYKCFCTPERLEEMRRIQQENKQAPRYDRHCRELDANEVNKKIEQGQSYVIRQKMPLIGAVKVFDELRGEITFPVQDLDDHVLLKSDGMPTYHLAVVVDDHFMEITHVVRGEDWIPTFPKNILLYHDFGWEPPKFIHTPLTLNKGGGKLSKRQGDVAVEDYRLKGYLPEALINFCVLLGWHPKGEQDIFTLEELEKLFDYKDVGTSAAVFDPDKLDYLNGYYIRHKSLDELVELCRPYMEGLLSQTPFEWMKSDRYLKNVIRLEKDRIKKLSEIAEFTDFFFVDQPVYESDLLVWKKLTSEGAKTNLDTLHCVLEKIPEANWTDDSIEEAVMTHVQAVEGRVGEYLWPMRAALTGRKASPGPFEVAETLGKELTLARIKHAFGMI